MLIALTPRSRAAVWDDPRAAGLSPRADRPDGQLAPPPSLSCFFWIVIKWSALRVAASPVSTRPPFSVLAAGCVLEGFFDAPGTQQPPEPGSDEEESVSPRGL